MNIQNVQIQRMSSYQCHSKHVLCVYYIYVSNSSTEFYQEHRFLVVQKQMPLFRWNMMSLSRRFDTFCVVLKNQTECEFHSKNKKKKKIIHFYINYFVWWFSTPTEYLELSEHTKMIKWKVLISGQKLLVSTNVRQTFQDCNWISSWNISTRSSKAFSQCATKEYTVWTFLFQKN